MKINYKELYKVFSTSAIEAIKWSFLKWLGTTAVAITVGLIIPVGKEVFEWNSLTVLYTIITILGSLYLLRFLLIATKETIKFFHLAYKESVYGDTIILLKDSFAEAHYYRKTPDFNDEEFMKSMMIFCNNLKKCFDNITKSECSVSIKVPVKSTKVDSSSVLKNLTRDVSNSKRDTKTYINTEHTIIGNSAFSYCLDNVLKNKKEKFYINDDINNENNYRNTSKESYDDGILPYNSELIYPIIPIKGTEKDNFDCHGFICIDSNKKKSFDRKYDPAIVSGVADGIYDIIVQLNEEKNGN